MGEVWKLVGNASTISNENDRPRHASIASRTTRAAIRKRRNSKAAAIARTAKPIAIRLTNTSWRNSGSSRTVTRLNCQENGQTGVVCAAGTVEARNAAAVTIARPISVSIKTEIIR